MLESWMIAKLFWPKKLIVINDKGEVNFSKQGISYSYQLFEPKLFFAHKNSRVIVHYSIDSPETVYLFTEESKDFIGEVKLRPTWTKDKPEVRHKHVGAVNKIHAYIKRERNFDRIAAISEDDELLQSRLDNLTKRLNKKLAKMITQNPKQHESRKQILNS